MLRDRRLRQHRRPSVACQAWERGGRLEIKHWFTGLKGISHTWDWIQSASDLCPQVNLLVLDLLLLQVLQTLHLLAVPLPLLLEPIRLLRAFPLPLVVLLADGPFNDSWVASDADAPRLLKSSSDSRSRLNKLLDGVYCNTECGLLSADASGHIPEVVSMLKLLSLL
jgi:hypothetical protein